MEPPETWAKEPDLSRLQLAYAELAKNAGVAVKILQELESQGSTMSLVYLGYAFERGIGVTQDLSRAESYYRHAHEAGSVGGTFGLGSVFLREQQYREAEQMFLLGVSKNDMRSIYWLARLYLRAESSSTHKAEGIKLLERGYLLGHVLSGRTLSKKLIRGCGGITGIFRGIFIFFESAILGVRLIIQNPSDERLKDAPM